MRSTLLFVLLASLALTVSAVPVPFKWCGSSKDDSTVDSIVSNEFPPVKGDTLTLNVTGNSSKVVTSGEYKIVITVGGFPLPDITGDISAFRPLPWPTGELNITYTQDIPAVAPSGAYTVKISANDQDGTQIFCLTIAFQLADNDVDAALPAPLHVSEPLQASRPHHRIEKMRPISKMASMKSTLMKQNFRRL